MPHNGFSYVQQPFSPGPRGPASPASPAPSDSWGILRNKTIKNRQQRTIPLQNGNLVADVAVSRGVTERVPHPGSKKGCDFERDEVEKVRYTACTCDPDEFMRNKYTLRQYLWGRKTELFVSYQDAIA
jgi:chitin synthase